VKQKGIITKNVFKGRKKALFLASILFLNGDKNGPNFKKSEIDGNWDYNETL